MILPSLPLDMVAERPLVIEEGYLDHQEGHWVEDEEDGAEGFLQADDDAFWVYDEENYTWFQRRFQGGKMKRGFKGRRKGEGKRWQRIRRQTLLQEEERQVEPCR